MDSMHFRKNATSFCGQWLATAYSTNSTYSENVLSFCLAGKVAASPASEFTDWAKFASDSAAARNGQPAAWIACSLSHSKALATIFLPMLLLRIH